MVRVGRLITYDYYGAWMDEWKLMCGVDHADMKQCRGEFLRQVEGEGKGKVDDDDDLELLSKKQLEMIGTPIIFVFTHASPIKRSPSFCSGQEGVEGSLSREESRRMGQQSS